MPKFSVRFYAQYCDEYIVEASTQDDAVDIADNYSYLKSIGTPEALATLATYAEIVDRVSEQEYVDTDTHVNELDEDGNWLDA